MIRRDERGQVLVLLVGVLLAIVLGAVVLGGVAAAVGERGARQRAADLAALAGAKELREHYPRLYAAAGGITEAAYAAAGRRAALETARRNGVRAARAELVGASGAAPTRIKVTVDEPLVVGGIELAAQVVAEAELVPDAGAGLDPLLSGNPGEYAGPFAFRQGKPMRPDVALAFDRMAAAARAAGIHLLISSAFRSDAEQAILFARRPDPKWVAPPGRSLHRLGTELDLGPPAAYGWLAANAKRFHFVQRYAWEAWHFGFLLNASSSSRAAGRRAPARRDEHGGPRDDGHGPSGATLPRWVPSRYAPVIARAAQRWNVSGALLAAQIRQESGFDPAARSPAGAMGIAQFMPGTARQYGLRDPFDAAAAIDAQAHLMRDLLRRFGSVPLALAAYNAGPAPVARCHCIPPYPETTAYVAAILGHLNGMGDVLGTGLAGLQVRLVA